MKRICNDYYRVISDTNDGKGTRITLTGLKRRTPINVDGIRRDLSRHFSVINGGFRVAVNGTDIAPGDKFRNDDVEHVWRIDAERVVPNRGWTVSGTIYAMKSALDADDVGLTVMARGKLVQKSTTFGVRQGDKYTYSRITGEITADFFDEEEDLVSTNRQALIWESEKGEALQEWGKCKLVDISKQILADRKSRAEKPIRGDPAIAKWLDGLVPAEKKSSGQDHRDTGARRRL